MWTIRNISIESSLLYVNKLCWPLTFCVSVFQGVCVGSFRGSFSACPTPAALQERMGLVEWLVRVLALMWGRGLCAYTHLHHQVRTRDGPITIETCFKQVNPKKMSVNVFVCCFLCICCGLSSNKTWEHNDYHSSQISIMGWPVALFSVPSYTKSALSSFSHHFFPNLIVDIKYR